MASQIAAESGFDAITMSSLARRIGLSTAALYKHFGSKQELLGALALRVVTQLDAVLHHATRSERLGAWERLAAIVGAYTELYTQRPASAKLMNAFIVDPRALLTDEMRLPVWTLMEYWWGQMDTLVNALGPQTNDPYRVSWLMWTTTQGALVGWDFAQRRDMQDLNDMVREASMWMLRGAGADPARHTDDLWHQGFAHGAEQTRTYLLEPTDTP
jgi:AcrR family transcriptional regulator